MSEDYPKLTKKAQVLEVLKAGGHVVTELRAEGMGYGLAQLFNAAGEPVDAWQTAVVSNLYPHRFHIEDAGTKRIWRLKPC